MTALWTVCVLLAVLGVINAVAIVALTRQVGLLHLRAGVGAPSPTSPPAARALQPGDRLRLDPAGFLDGDIQPDLVLLGFVRPSCTHCAAALPAFAALAAGLPGTEKVLLVSDVDQATGQAYLAGHGVSLPLATGPHLLSANAIPAIPYAVVADGAGTVIAAENAGRGDRLEQIMQQARQHRLDQPTHEQHRQEERSVV